jgi:Tfp pilus assembly protein PilO
MKAFQSVNWFNRYPVALISLGLSVSLFAAILWRGPMIEAQEERLVELERELRQIQINSERAVGLEAEIVALEAALAGVKARLIDLDSVALNYQFFLDLERVSGVALEGFSQDPLSPGGWKLQTDKELSLYWAVPFVMEVVGEYSQIARFAHLIDNSSALTRLGYVSIDRFKDRTGEFRLRSKIVCHQLGVRDE